MNKKKIIVTGGSGIIGFALTKSLLSHGHKVISVDTNTKKINTLKRNNTDLIVIKANLNKENETKKFMSFCIKKFKIIDALVHCAYPRTKDWGTKLEKLKQKSLNENLINQLGSTIIISKIIINYFLKQKFGNLILLSSIMGLNNPKFETYKGTNMSSPIEYSAIKSGIISITKYLAKYYAKNNLKINCVSPGGIKNNQPNKFIQNYKKQCNIKGLLNSDDVVNTINFLLSKKSDAISGQNIVVDDGYSL
tara:strand:+ start:786 stop:1535 length:750 start_codon:yes stop_codon:yes gene_type:complete